MLRAGKRPYATLQKGHDLIRQTRGAITVPEAIIVAFAIFAIKVFEQGRASLQKQQDKLRAAQTLCPRLRVFGSVVIADQQLVWQQKPPFVCAVRRVLCPNAE